MLFAGALAAAARTLLFVPADRSELFVKAQRARPDLVVADLEDSVSRNRKSVARERARVAVAEGLAGAVRINAGGSLGHDDLTAFADLPCVVMVPKSENPDELVRISAAAAEGSAIVALVETARGVVQAGQIAAAPGVVRLAFGSFDLAAELGVSPDDRDAMYGARSALVLASAAAGIAGPVDGVTGALHDDEALRSDVAYGRRIGFTGKLCVHPRQVSVADVGLRPSAEELDWARRVLASATEADGVVSVDSRMVDKPVIERARRIVAGRGHLP